VKKKLERNLQVDIGGHATNGQTNHDHGHTVPVRPEPNQEGGQCACVYGFHPHPTTLLKPSPKESNKPKKEGIIKTQQGASHPPMWDKEWE